MTPTVPGIATGANTPVTDIHKEALDRYTAAATYLSDNLKRVIDGAKKDGAVTIYVSIGNSDDKLTQGQWASFYGAVTALIYAYASRIHGEWASVPHSAWQNACFAFEAAHPANVEVLKRELSKLAAEFGQDSIAWAEAPTTTFLKPSA